ncbi:GDSL-type esterase/lipase family protein [Mucilaginibacter psychrotolerans]|uniref:SGNH hydrolase-type esterase domain-containing protein n=1 Tax=Mucilaginibacter psychrotolerans TaxID=1524096 RepID=A0A4Y8RXZ8_9SPHI|nr:GDSL-type esterase/lipase family protein [Mucilaginibacter psychrotolerans]TFF29747.1 hypothetical protein E2R66_27890 [Mucilaginibacter psychrotolerans]
MRAKSNLLKFSLFLNLVFVMFFIGKRVYYHYYFFFNPPFTETDRWNNFLNKSNDTLANVFIGTSLTSGFPVHSEFSNDTVRNAGFSGAKSGFILEHFKLVLKHHPRKIFIEAGTNDINFKVSIDTFITNMSTMIQLARRSSARIYVQSILPTRRPGMNEWIPTWNAKLKQLCVENNVPFIDLYPHYLDDDGMLDKDLTTDGIHLTAAGYYVWRKNIQPFLNAN